MNVLGISSLVVGVLAAESGFTSSLVWKYLLVTSVITAAKNPKNDGSVFRLSSLFVGGMVGHATLVYLGSLIGQLIK